MNEKKFRRRGWITGGIAPVVWLLYMIGQWTGLWKQTPAQDSLLSTYVAILMVFMVAGTAAPLWWLLSEYRKKNRPGDRPIFLIGLNFLALLIGVLYFF